jgi:hypothetical protein
VQYVHYLRDAETVDAMERPEKEPEVKAQVGAHDSRSTSSSACMCSSVCTAALQFSAYFGTKPPRLAFETFITVPPMLAALDLLKANPVES